MLALLVLFAIFNGVTTEGKRGFQNSAYSQETVEAIHTAFEDNDYAAYLTAVSAIEGKAPLSEDEFNDHVARMTLRQGIQDAVVSGDYAVYLTLTGDDIGQLTEQAFTQRSEFAVLKSALKTALEDRNYDAFVEKHAELREMRSGIVNNTGHGYGVGRKGYHGFSKSSDDEIREEKFNEMADQFEEHGEGFMWKGKHSWGRKKGHAGCSKESNESEESVTISS